MTKLLTATVCVLGLVAGLARPAQAGPTETKTITLACTSVTGHDVIGQAVLELCSDLSCTQNVPCPYGFGSAICNSDTVQSTTTTISCTAPFRVTAITYDLILEDSDIVETPTNAAGSMEEMGTKVLSKGSPRSPQFSLTLQSNADPDSVTLSVTR